MLDFHVLSEITLPSEPDVLLFSPLDVSVLIVGTYHLEEDASRSGTLLTYKIKISPSEPTACTLVHTVQCSAAVLDAHWHPVQPGLLLVALSNGCTATYKLVLDTPDPHLQLVSNAQLFPETCLVLSLAPNLRSNETLATLSTGEVAVMTTRNDTMELKQTWKAHDLEVWCSSWKTENTVLTGGDDALLKIWDLRDDTTTQSMVSKCHNAGVTATLPLTDNLLLTGSYDNFLRLLDYRNLRTPISSIDLDGGVWRILPRPRRSTTSFLTCCMQSGARTVSLLDNTSLKRAGNFEPQENRRLIYGASWQTEKVAAISSFYEKQLYLCQIP